MKHFCRIWSWLLWTSLATLGLCQSPPTRDLRGLQLDERAELPGLVTWDKHSFFIRGERMMLWSGEVHPFRLPVPGLWLDMFQKIKSMSFNYGIFALEGFFQAATDAGIYLLARPGPYINAEASGGGFPGWLQRIPGTLRSTDPSFLNATQNYVTHIGSIIEKASIANGGPVILFQPENESAFSGSGVDYQQAVNDLWRDSGVALPFINNDPIIAGMYAPGTGVGEVDVYGEDWYPLSFDCSTPSEWPASATLFSGYRPDLRVLHLQQSPSTPFAIVEMQGGSSSYWGGPGEGMCLDYTGPNFEQVIYKADLAFGAAFLNFYMTYGGTNWGNLGHPGGYTSYDYGAVIAENLMVDRQKYSEQKLIVNFVMAAGSTYLTATPANNNSTGFYVVRHNDYTSQNTTTYKLKVPTSKGDLTIPRIAGHLTLFGRDSKIHITDYDVNGLNLLYSTAEMFTMRTMQSRTVLVLYGGSGERHELAFTGKHKINILEGSSVVVKIIKGTTTFNWTPNAQRTVLEVGNTGVYVYLLDRQTAYNYWVLPISSSTSSATSGGFIVAQAGYLIRNATVSGRSLAVTEDVNATTNLEIIMGAPSRLSKLTFNGVTIDYTQDKYGVVRAVIPFQQPVVNVPDLSSLVWKYHDSLPEISSSYDDSMWPAANLRSTYNTDRNLTTPTSPYGGDYGFTAGSLLYRGHFTSTGNETALSLTTQGGTAFASSVWLNSTLLGSWHGDGASSSYISNLTFPKLTAGRTYVITVVIDHMGLDEDLVVYEYLDRSAKTPRGILDYTLFGRNQSAISWKLTGNLGGEAYKDLSRGPLNEGGMYAERQGWHLPAPPSTSWETQSPITGISKAGIAFYSTSFDLNMPVGYTRPLSVVFANTTSPSAVFRVQIFVNGYQFGEYVNNIGPQTVFPVPEGIWNYHGTNYLALTLWALEASGAALNSGFKLQVDGIVQSGYGSVALSPMPAWANRPDAY